MPELTADMFVSLDGFAADETGGQGFTIGYDGPEFTSLVQQVLDAPQTIIMGRVTYEEMARHWPVTGGPIAERMNAHPKLVFSRALAEPLSWANARLATRGLAEEITILKHEAGAPLRSVGSIKLVREMVALGLVDRLRLVVFPRIVGAGGQEPMFGGYGQVSLELIASSVLDSQILVLEYRPT